MKLNIPINEIQKNKLLEMIEFYFKKEITDSVYPYFADFDMIALNENDFIHWFELTINHLSRRVFETKFYWLIVFHNKFVHLYCEHQPHPIDWLYDMFSKQKNNEAFIDKMTYELGSVAEKEDKPLKKESKVKASKESKLDKDKVSKKIIEDKPKKKNDFFE